jgi:hypothetical protein
LCLIGIEECQTKEEIFNRSDDSSECESIPEEFHHSSSIPCSPTPSCKNTIVINEEFLTDKIDIEDSNDLNESNRVDRNINLMQNNRQEEDKMRIKSMMKNCTSSLNFHRNPKLHTLKMEGNDQILIDCSSVKNLSKATEEVNYRSHKKNASPFGLSSKFAKFSPFKASKKAQERRKYNSNSKSFTLPSGSSINVKQEHQFYAKSLHEFVDSNINCINNLIEYKQLTNQKVIKLNNICK